MCNVLLYFMQTAELFWSLASMFCPGLLPGPVPAVFIIQTKTSAPSTMTWSLQRAAAWPKNHLKSQIHRCSSKALFFTLLHLPLSNVSVVWLYLSACTRSSPWIPLEFSFASLAVQCFVSVHIPVSLTWMHSARRCHKTATVTHTEKSD